MEARGLCINCLAHSHVTKNCKSDNRCRICAGAHHTLLHAGCRLSVEALERHLYRTYGQGRSLTEVMLAPTAIVTVQIYGQRLEVRAVLNPSQPSWMHFSLVKQLGGDLCRKTTFVGVSSSRDNGFQRPMEVLIEYDDPPVLPPASAGADVAQGFDNLILADPHFGKAALVRMQIGVEFYSSVIKEGLIKRPGLPIAQNTVFGWVISGPCKI